MAPGKIAEQLSNLAIHSAEAGLERGSPLPVVGRGRGIELPQGGGDALHHAHGVRNREPVVRIDQAVMRRRRQGNLRLARPPMCRMDLAGPRPQRALGVYHNGTRHACPPG